MGFLAKFVVLALAVVCIHAAETEVDNEITPKAAQPTAEDRGRLFQDLFNNYDKRNYPSHNVVKFGVALLRIDVNEPRNTLESDIWLRQTWTDPRLKWNPEEYGNQTVLRVPAAEVWKPDVTLYNSANVGDSVKCIDTMVLVYNTGMVLWVPPCHFRTYCNFTLDRAPLDEQSCNLKFGSWTFDGYLMDIQFYDAKALADISDFTDISNWALTGNAAEREVKYYDCCKEPYVSLNYKLSIKRKAGGGSCRA